MFKKISFIALAVPLMILAACAQGQTGGGAAATLPDVIKIGFISPLTGNAAAYGQDVKHGIEIYVSEHPAIAGKPIQMIWEDGKCNGQDAANAAQKLINVDKVQVIIGGSCSGETLAFAPIAEANKVLVISPLSSSPALTTAGDYIFRNYPSDMKVSETMVDYVIKNHKKVAMITEQTDFGQGYRKAVNEHLTNKGKKDMLVLDEAYPADNTDFRTLLTKVKESGADALIAIVQAPVTGGFVTKQAAELGLKVQIFSGDALPGPDFFSTAKDKAEGVKVAVVSEDPSRKGYTDFATKFVAKYGKPAASNVFPAFGYDAATIVANGIAAVGYDGTALKDYLKGMPTFKGIASDVTFDENGDNNVPAFIKVAKNGEFVLEK